MQEKDFKAIFEQMPSELRMKLEQIKMFLSQDKASVMVGAGFSKNAQQMGFATMKDWPELTKSFYDQLFIGEKKPKESILHEPLKLAQMYECSFGRNALDAHIQSSLPNEATTPGKLHHDLMKLNWRDVFTTNYDTLLERASVGTDRTYQVVTNKETLLYANSPRIIKLHGSFPNIRPYIITEEDFRTYPQKYPEFVNTVRQALMESLFCLIGFSGDDPNFLQWMGWLRDVMGNQMSPAYLITYEPNLHKSQVDLFKGRGIEIVNMATLKNDISYSEGLEFVISFLSKDSSKKWNPMLEIGRIETKEDVEKATKMMQSIRETYPHYLYLPQEYHADFDEIYLFRNGIDTSILKNMEKSHKIRFIREIVWRYEVSLSPITIPWVLEDMDSLSFNEEQCDKETIHDLNEIRLSLMTIFRIFGLPEHYTHLVEILSKQALSKEQRNRYYYEQSIHELGLLDYKKVQGIVSQWDVDGTDIQSALWKAIVLLELGQDNEALNILNTTNQRFRQSLLTQGVERKIMNTYSNALEEVMKLFERQSVVDNSLVKLKSYFIQKITEAESKPTQVYENIHKFGIDHEQYMWHSETNHATKRLYGYKYLRLIEQVGYPFGHTKFPINETWLGIAVQVLLSAHTTYAMRVLVRSRSKNVTIGCFNRKNVLTINQQWANKQYELYKDKIEQYIVSSINGPLEIRVSDVLLPAFAHLAPRMSMTNVLDLSTQYLACYNKRKLGYDSSFLQTIQGCMSARSRVQLNQKMFSANPDDAMMQLPWSALWMEQTPVLEADVNKMLSYLSHWNDKDDARLHMRLWYMLNADLKTSQRKKLEDGVRKWRNKEHSINVIHHILDTYKLVPYLKGVDEYCETKFITAVVNNVRDRKVEDIRSTTTLNKFRTSFAMLAFFASQLSVEQHEILLSKMQSLLVNNEDILKNDDSETFMGGLRGELQRLMVQFTKYVANADLHQVNYVTMQDLQDVCIRYMNYKVATIAIVTALNNYTNRLVDIAMLGHIKDTLITGDYLEYASGLQSISITKDRKVQLNLISTIVDYASYALNNRTKHFVNTIMGLLINGYMNPRVWGRRINELLVRIADSVTNYEGAEELRMDVMYYTNMLAGAVSAKWQDTEGTKRWRKITKEEANFNDVRVGFDIGQANVIADNSELLGRLEME